MVMMVVVYPPDHGNAILNSSDPISITTPSIGKLSIILLIHVPDAFTSQGIGVTDLDRQEKYNNTEMKSGRLFTVATQHLTSAVVIIKFW